MNQQIVLFPTYARPKVAELPIREQPVMRVLHDSGACSTTELLATLVGGPYAKDTAEALLVKFKTLSGIAQANVTELAQVRGIGDVSAARLKAALQIATRISREAHEAKIICSPADAAAIFMDHFVGKDQECLLVMLLNTRNGLIDVVELYRGSLNMTMIRVGEIFREAIRRNAASIIIAHNHPSGDPMPSPDDTSVTRLIVEAGKMLDISLNDHLIIGHNRFVSLKERGLGFGS